MAGLLVLNLFSPFGHKGKICRWKEDKVTKTNRIDARLKTRLTVMAVATLLAATPAAIPATAAAPAVPAHVGGHEYTVVIDDMDFGQTPDNAKVGDTIVWVNRDSVMHSVTARDHSFDIRLGPGQSAKMPLSSSGRIAFFCLFHPSMRGVLNVAP
ncbi:cupredoxin domain-containing protein [Gluconacetobacter tumulicola]|nr:hypothetical protein [Gluconacetobacter tumulicola]